MSAPVARGGSSFTLIVVLFILLIIVGTSYTHPVGKSCGCGGYGYGSYG
jgi:uncharacterized protein (TIGR01732 family)